jgi:hypothetical protein
VVVVSMRRRSSSAARNAPLTAVVTIGKIILKPA